MEGPHEGDIRAQINLSIDNLEIVLDEAGMKLSDVVRLNWYTTDMEAFRGASDTLRGRLESAECRATTTQAYLIKLERDGRVLASEDGSYRTTF